MKIPQFILRLCILLLSIIGFSVSHAQDIINWNTEVTSVVELTEGHYELQRISSTMPAGTYYVVFRVPAGCQFFVWGDVYAESLRNYLTPPRLGVESLELEIPERHLVGFDEYVNDGFPSNRVLYIDNIYDTIDLHMYIDVCRPGSVPSTSTINITSESINSNVLHLQWEDYSNATEWTVNSRISSKGWWTDTTVTSPECYIHIPDYLPSSAMFSSEQFWLRITNNITEYTNLHCQVSQYSINLPCESDIDIIDDFTKLSTCQSQPYVLSILTNADSISSIMRDETFNQGLIRQAIMTDTNAYDPNTENRLKIIPPGETRSVRLGNTIHGGDGAQVIYKLTVDTLKGDILLLNYAAVMLSPNHTLEKNPHVEFQLLDEDMNELDQNCYSFLFVAGNDLGWNTVNNNNVEWKDWTPVSVDLTPLHGQTIYISILARGCMFSAHYGYVYYTLKCERKSMRVDACGYNLASSCTAPQGFDYSWYDADDRENILSTEQIFNVDRPGDFRCWLSYMGSQGRECGLEMRAYLGPHFPVANFEVNELSGHDCVYKYRFTNLSTVVADEEGTIDLNMPCDSYLWDFGDGTTSTAVHPLHEYSGGEYNITLKAMLANGQCVDSLTQHLIVGYTSSAEVLEWIDESELPHTFSNIVFSHGVEDTLIMLKNSIGCDSLLHYTLRVKRIMNYADTLCQGEFPVTIYNMEFTTFGMFDTIYYDRTSNIYLECHIVLKENAAVYTPVTMSVCYGQPVEWEGQVFTEPGIHEIHHLTPFGCDSIVLLNIEYRRDCSALWVPNIITPNQQTNNTFKLYGSELIAAETWIYNRQGVLVTTLSTKDDEWRPTAESIAQASYTIFVKYKLASSPDRWMTYSGQVLVVY